jgi:hypothetical protein
MFGATTGDRIGKGRQTLTHIQSDIFYLDIALAQTLVLQQQVNATFLLTVANLTANLAITLQLRNQTSLNQFAHQIVGSGGINPCQMPL